MQRFEFTPAAERALRAAAKWTFAEARVTPNELQGPELLLGLLGEQECRAAIYLAESGIDAPKVLRRWPSLCQGAQSGEAQSREDSQPKMSPSIYSALHDVRYQLREVSLSPELATEHLLLALTKVDHEVAHWLRKSGLDASGIDKDLATLQSTNSHAGELAQEPLPVDWEDDCPAREQEIWQDAAGCKLPAGGSGTPVGEKGVAEKEVTETAVEEPQAPVEDSPLGEPGELVDRSQSSNLPRNAASPSPGEQVICLRIIDAAANRAAEGLRVVEDYVRFGLNDLYLTTICKQLRHDLAESLSYFNTDALLTSRETIRDVGTRLTIASEQRRATPGDVVTANIKRFQEAIRSLAEFAKVFDGNIAADLEQLRYHSYTLQRAIASTIGNRGRLQHAQLYVLIDGCATGEDFRRLVSQLISARVDIIQLRDKQLEDSPLLARAKLLREMTRDTNTLFIMNDRPDLALLSCADGVHLGQEELSVHDARSILGPERMIGLSTHSLEQARQGVLDGASYLGVGPTFSSPTKEFSTFPGLELLRQVAAEITLPAFAIGGISMRNLSQVLSTQFCRVALSSGVVAQDDPQESAQWFAEQLKNDGLR